MTADTFQQNQPPARVSVQENLKAAFERLLADPKVQGALILRAASYWLYCLLSVTLMMVCWVVIAERPASSTEMWNTVVSRCGPALFASMLLLPVALIDMARMSNRFAGPITYDFVKRKAYFLRLRPPKRLLKAATRPPS